MKGNLKLKVAILIAFSCFCLVKPTWAQEVNCGNVIKIINTTPVSYGLDGKLVAHVEGPNSFEVRLYEVSGKGKFLKEAIKRSRSGEITFNDLKEGNYKIIVEYHEVTGPMCQFLQLGGISIKKQ